MMKRSSIRQLFTRPVTRRIRKAPRRVRLALEALESRLAPSVNVLTFHNDIASTGLNPNETQLTPANVTVNSFGKLYTTSVDGQVYAEPLIDTGVTIANGPNTQAGAAGVHDVVFVATENDSLYAIDASSTGGAVLWQRTFLDVSNANNNTLGATAITTVLDADVSGNGNISPVIGITGTPVIDPATNTLYLVAKTKETIGGNTHFVQRLHAVNISDGTDRVAPYLLGDTTNGNTNNTPIYVYGTGYNGANNGVFDSVTDPYNGTGKPVVQFSALHENQRGALNLVNNTIYVEWASHGDTDPYHGWVVALDVSNLQTSGWRLSGVFCPSANGGEAGIWQGGGRLAFEANGSAMYFETANGPGTATANPVLDGNNFPVDGNYYNALVKLVADSSTTPTNQNLNGWGLKVADYFMPYNTATLNPEDGDFGSGAPMILPDSAGITGHPHLIVAAGKTGQIYLVDRDNMGKFNVNAPTDNVLNSVPDGSGHLTPPVLIGSFPDGSYSTPAFYNGTIYWISGYQNDGTNTNYARTFVVNAGTAATITPTGASESGSTVTITTTAAHGFVAGQTVLIAGVGVAGYNGVFTIVSVPSTTTFTYTNPSTGLAASGGGNVTYATVSQTSQASITNFGNFPGSPVVSANGTTGGITWIMDRHLNQIHAYDASNGTFNTELWNSGQRSGGLDSLNSTVVKFAVPTVANGLVYVGTTNSLVVYGLLLTATGTPVTATEGTAFSGQVASFSDADGDPASHYTATITWGDGNTSTGTIQSNGSGGFNVIGTNTYAEEGSYPVTITITDTDGSTAMAASTASVADAPWTVGAITAPAAPTLVNTGISVTATFTDPGGPGDTHTAVWSWGDGTTSTGTVNPDSGATGTGSVSGNHTYTAAGLYTITLTVMDDDGVPHATLQFVPVFDPNAGFVIGDGEINSPAGAFAGDPTLSGPAEFDFESQYEQGALVPTGETEFQFEPANLDFQSTSYQWLVVSGAQAIFQGTGTINEAGNFGFFVSAVDGTLDGSGQDKFRIQIVDLNNNNAVVYDTQPGAPLNAVPTTLVTDGEIRINPTEDALQVAGGPVPDSAAGPRLTVALAQPALQEAVAQWAAVGAEPAQVRALSQVRVRVTDLPGSYLGLAFPGVIWLDQNAAGHGWFLDPTPAPLGRVDLLTVLDHELGHELGLEHSADPASVMYATVAPGVVRAPSPADLNIPNTDSGASAQFAAVRTLFVSVPLLPGQALDTTGPAPGVLGTVVSLPTTGTVLPKAVPERPGSAPAIPLESGGGYSVAEAVDETGPLPLAPAADPDAPLPALPLRPVEDAAGDAPARLARWRAACTAYFAEDDAPIAPEGHKASVPPTASVPTAVPDDATPASEPAAAAAALAVVLGGYWRVPAGSDDPVAKWRTRPVH